MPLMELLLVVVAIIVMASFFIYVYRKENSDAHKQKVKDLEAPARASKALAAARRFAGENGCQILTPATLAKNGRYADLDFIIAGSFGLLCVKCIGLGGEIYGNAGDAKWLRVTSDEREPFNNPITEAAADTRMVRDALFTAHLKNVPVETVCVFTNPKATLALPRNTGHYTLKDFRELLDREKYRADRHVEPEKALEAVRVWLAPDSAIK